MLNDKVAYSAEIFGNPIIALVSALATITGFFFLFEGLYICEDIHIKGIKSFLELCGRNSIIILCTHMIFIFSFRVIESAAKMTIHTFPALIVFGVTLIGELILIRFIPHRLLVLFGK